MIVLDPLFIALNVLHDSIRQIHSSVDFLGTTVLSTALFNCDTAVPYDCLCVLYVLFDGWCPHGCFKDFSPSAGERVCAVDGLINYSFRFHIPVQVVRRALSRLLPLSPPWAKPRPAPLFALVWTPVCHATPNAQCTCVILLPTMPYSPLFLSSECFLNLFVSMSMAFDLRMDNSERLAESLFKFLCLALGKEPFRSPLAPRCERSASRCKLGTRFAEWSRLGPRGRASSCLCRVSFSGVLLVI